MIPLPRQIASYAKQIHACGFVANHDGNLSVRQADGKRFWATPTATSKRLIDASDVVCVDIDGKILSGRKKLFGEWHLHAACYQARPDVLAVMHAHPPAATALGLAGKSLGVPALPEMIVSLGKNIPLIPFAMPKSTVQDKHIAHELTAGDADAFLISGNGVVSVGVDLEQAFLRMELVEHYAQIFLHALAMGGPRALAEDDVKKLLDARTRAGFGRTGRGETGRT